MTRAAALVVEARKGAPLQQRDAHRREMVRADGVKDARLLLGRLGWVPGDRPARTPSAEDPPLNGGAPMSRPAAVTPGRLASRRSSSANAARIGGRVRRALRRQTRPERQHAGGIEARIDDPQLRQAAQQQSRAHEQDDGQGDLRDDELPLQTATVAANASRVAREVALGRCPHGGEAGKQADQQRRQDGGARRERQDHEVGLDAARSRAARRGRPAAPRAPATVAASTPHNPPTHDRMTLSATICEASCRRPAPSAARTTSSCRRAEARASSRLPTFAQAMSSTRPTAPSSATRIARRSPTRSSARLTTLTPTPRFSSGYCPRQPRGDQLPRRLAPVPRSRRRAAARRPSCRC